MAAKWTFQRPSVLTCQAMGKRDVLLVITVAAAVLGFSLNYNVLARNGNGVAQSAMKIKVD